MTVEEAHKRAAIGDYSGVVIASGVRLTVAEAADAATVEAHQRRLAEHLDMRREFEEWRTGKRLYLSNHTWYEQYPGEWVLRARINEAEAGRVFRICDKNGVVRVWNGPGMEKPDAEFEIEDLPADPNFGRLGG